MKLRSMGLCCLALIVPLLGGCGASAPVKVNSQALSEVRTVAVVKVPEPREYTVINKGSMAGALGPVGGVKIALDARKDQKGLLGALARTHFSFADQLTADLEAALKARGYDTRVVTVQREKPHQLLGKHDDQMSEGVDAVLDIANKGVGYATQHWMNSSFWRPKAYIQLGLFTRESGDSPAYQETFMYGYHNPLLSGTDLDAPETYRFKNREAMEAASDETLVNGLKDASQAIAREVAAKLAR